VAGTDVAARQKNLNWTFYINVLPSRFADECHAPQLMTRISFHIPPPFSQCFRDCGMTIYSQQPAESNTASDVLGRAGCPTLTSVTRSLNQLYWYWSCITSLLQYFLKNPKPGEHPDPGNMSYVGQYSLNFELRALIQISISTSNHNESSHHIARCTILTTVTQNRIHEQEWIDLHCQKITKTLGANTCDTV